MKKQIPTNNSKKMKKDHAKIVVSKLKNSLKNTYLYFLNNLLFSSIHYFLLVLISALLFIKAIIWFNSLGPLMDFFVSTAKPMYQATGNLDPVLMSKVLLLGDQLKVIGMKLLLLFFVVVIVFSILRAWRDRYLLTKTNTNSLLAQRKIKLWFLSLSIFGVTILALAIILLINYLFDNLILLAISPWIFFILQRFLILLVEDLLLNKKFSWKKTLYLFLFQLASLMFIVIILLVIGILLFLISELVAIIVIILIFYLLWIIREHFLIEIVKWNWNNKLSNSTETKKTKPTINTLNKLKDGQNKKITKHYHKRTTKTKVKKIK